MSSRNYFYGTLVVLAGIVYLSLYPFRLRTGLPAGGPVHELLLTWRSWPTSRGDAIANILLYLPWGFFATRSFNPNTPSVLRLLVATVLGAMLSVAMELSQFYIAERYSDMYDVYTNTLGSFLGALGGLALGSDRRGNLVRTLDFQLFPALLLAAFMLVHLYPFVPVIDLHKYVAAMRPLLAPDTLTKSALFLLGVTWLVICSLVETLFGRRSALAMFLAVAAIVFGGEIVIVDARLSLPNVVSAALAALLWFAAMRYMPGRIAVLAIAFSAVVMLERLSPFRLNPVGHGFEWVPFLDLLRAPIETGFLVMIDKFFLYGGLIWLLMKAGLRLWRATVAVALLLLFCSLVEMYLPGRSAGITDALLALLIGTLLRLMTAPKQARPLPA